MRRNISKLFALTPNRGGYSPIPDSDGKFESKTPGVEDSSSSSSDSETEDEENENIGLSFLSTRSMILRIGLDQIRQSLTDVNHFAEKRHEKLKNILVLEISSDARFEYKRVSLRELLNNVHDEAQKTENEISERMKALNDHRHHHPNQLGPRSISRQTSTKKIRHSTRIRFDSFVGSMSRHLKNSNAKEFQPIKLRDLRKLDPSFPCLNESTILVKKHLVIFATVSLDISSLCESVISAGRTCCVPSSRRID